MNAHLPGLIQYLIFSIAYAAMNDFGCLSHGNLLFSIAYAAMNKDSSRF